MPDSPQSNLSDAEIQNTALAEALTVLSLTDSPTDIPIPTPKSISDAAQVYLDEYGGILDSYIDILSLSDCVLLQEKFEISYSNNQRETAGTALFKTTLGYM
ncbi:MAG: hypothetical protein QGD96_10520, partial [Anaerolineae bacterium]|nr:hypothetical protein [Anaerolineae bacterium]